MQQALVLAEDALKNGEFPVGCVIECNGKIIATGRRENSSGYTNELDHGEMRALRSLVELQPDMDMSKVTVYSTLEPCLMCFSTLLVNGVRRFVYGYEDVMGGGTNLPLALLSPLYRDLEVTVVDSILRGKSLGLFKKFFTDPENGYLKNTLLCQYTLEQKL